MYANQLFLVKSAKHRPRQPDSKDNHGSSCQALPAPTTRGHLHKLQEHIEAFALHPNPSSTSGKALRAPHSQLPEHNKASCQRKTNIFYQTYNKLTAFSAPWTLCDAPPCNAIFGSRHHTASPALSWICSSPSLVEWTQTPPPSQWNGPPTKYSSRPPNLHDGATSKTSPSSSAQLCDTLASK